MTHKYIFRLCSVLVLAAGLGYGQSNEVSFSGGAIFASGQTATTTIMSPFPCTIPNCNVISNVIKAGTGFTFQASYARRFANAGPVALYLEFPVVGTPGHTVDAVVNISNLTSLNASTSSSSFFLTPSARVKFFSSARVSPWATVGGGWARLTLGAQNTDTGALQFGGGVDFKTGVPHLAVRGEVRDFWSAGALQAVTIVTLPSTTVVSPVHQHHLFAGGGVVFTF